MQTETDPYELLGVPRDATLQDVKLAYRKAALECHPDRFDGDQAEAERRLRDLIAAYKDVARKLDPSAWTPAPPPTSRTYTPQDFAREGSAAYWRPPADQGGGPGGTGAHETTVVESTRNETATFLILWALAIFLGILFGGAAASYRAYTCTTGELQTSDIIISIVVGELIYVVLAALAVVMVILTRKIVRLTIRFAHNHWRFLPAPTPEQIGKSTRQELPHHSGKHTDS